jgi:anaerobic magnesium-protoporphyrin IX monomethyl ester cyclase
MKIVLIRPAYSADIYGNVYRQDKDTAREIRPPLGLMALAGYCKKQGHDVRIIDGEPDLLNEQDTVDRTLALAPDIVGLTSTTPEYPFAHGIVKRIKQRAPHVITVFGGAHITNLPEHTMEDLDPYVDWGVLYEGEKPLAAIAAGRGASMRWSPDKHPKLLHAPSRLTGAELDSFTPDRTRVDMSKYRFVDTSLGLVSNDAVEMARGCPFGCVFCTSRRTSLAKRSVGATLAEIQDSVERYGTRLVMFFDDTFTVHRERAEELLTEVILRKRQGRLPHDVHLNCFTRANTLDEPLVALMKEAGCDKISIGIETGNAELLHNMQKGTVLDDYRTAYRILDDAGIAKRGSFIIGHPYETEATIAESIAFARELDLDEIGVNIMTPYPGQVTFRDALGAKGIWLAHDVHYPELRRSHTVHDAWSDYLQVNWHDYWREHLRWGRATVETETLSTEALVYWHGRFLQEVYGSPQMARRRARHIAAGNNDAYWHRPWRVHAARNEARIAAEARDGMPVFAAPKHTRFAYRPIGLRDYQKNELHMSAARAKRTVAAEPPMLVPALGVAALGAFQP